MRRITRNFVGSNLLLENLPFFLVEMDGKSNYDGDLHSDIHTKKEFPCQDSIITRTSMNLRQSICEVYVRRRWE